VREAPEGVEVARRRGPDADYLFLINHTDRAAHIPVSPEATELLSGKPATGSVTVPPGEVAVVREPLRA
ncbi:Beta-galactosidase C-terminal domain, partial [Streptomyces sp. NPDC002144]